MDISHIDTILEECFVHLENGKTIDDCLALYPQEADTLRGLLDVSQQLHDIPPLVISAAAQSQGLQQMLAAVSPAVPPLAPKSKAAEVVRHNRLPFFTAAIITLVFCAWTLSIVATPFVNRLDNEPTSIYTETPENSNSPTLIASSTPDYTPRLTSTVGALSSSTPNTISNGVNYYRRPEKQ